MATPARRRRDQRRRSHSDHRTSRSHGSGRSRAPSGGARHAQPLDLDALHGRDRRRRGRPRRGRAARRRHRPLHRPLAEGQVRRATSPPRTTGSGGARSTSRSTRRTSSGLRDKVVNFLEDQDLYVVDAFAGADPAHRIAVRVITSRAYHALFAATMFIEPTDEELADFEPQAVVLHAPEVEADPDEDGTRTGTFVALHPTRLEILIGGTFYAGEIKKSIFTLMNDRLPLEGVFPMHCSANVGDDGRRRDLLRPLRHRQDDALGRPGARADRRRRARLGRQRRLQLRGRLLREGDPALAPRPSPRSTATTHTFGTILENVAVDERGELDLDDDSKTENTRAAYKLEQIPNALPDEARRPPAERRLPDRRRVRDPAADRAADPRPGALLLPLRLHGEARRHRDRRRPSRSRRSRPASARRSCRSRRRSTRGCSARSSTEHGATVWLVNTGWTGGPFGEGQRMPIAATRALLHAALSGALDAVEYRTDALFGFEVPVEAPGRRRDAARPALDLARPRGVRPQGARARPDVPRRTSRRFARRRPSRRRGRAARLTRSRARSLRPRAFAGSVRAQWMRTHDVLVVGAGCAGMRAAIEAHDAGADVAIDLEAPPDAQPLRRGRGRHQRGARQRGRGRRPRRTPSTRSRAPTTSATRTRSRSSRARRPATSTSSSTGARSSRAARTASSRSARSAPPARRARSSPPTSPATS